jgi:hypothetical protein
VAEYRFLSLDSARTDVLKMDAPLSAIKDRLDYVDQLHALAVRIPGGHLKKIVWTVDDGYPPHAAGYVQWTVRPFYQGYGCDGTTDGCVHFIASTICEHLGIDYAAAYAEAYEDTSLPEAKAMVQAIISEQTRLDEIILPSMPPTRQAVSLMLSDLYAVNNRSLCEVLVEKLSRVGFDVKDFCLTERALKASYLASLQPIAA